MASARLVELATNATRWSILKAFTNSRAAQLTVLAPFIGYLIVFNSELKLYLNFNLPENSNSVMVEWLKVHSLTYLYFGLVLYGVATAIFSISCPNNIKENKNIIEYVQKMEEVKTRNLVRRHLNHLLQMFLQLNSGERSSPFFADLHPSFPTTAASPLHLMIEELAASGISDEETIVSFQTGSGNWMTNEIMESMLSERRVERVFWMPLYSASFDLSKDVFYVSYLADDYKLFFVRVLNLMFFLLGVGFLIVPTIATIIAVIFSFF